MNYFLTVLGLLGIIKPDKFKEIIYNILYIMPFWLWGILFLSLAGIARLWILAIIGLLFLFFPKRKIKKTVELIPKISNQKIRIFIILLIIAIWILW
ncbi:MAG: hypothetical protein PHV25_01940 [Candidatus Pacebacteria bacterium]|nr:hypothetical protein [Candidatus Paceibacterota bacterium]